MCLCSFSALCSHGDRVILLDEVRRAQRRRQVVGVRAPLHSRFREPFHRPMSSRACVRRNLTALAGHLRLGQAEREEGRGWARGWSDTVGRLVQQAGPNNARGCSQEAGSGCVQEAGGSRFGAAREAWCEDHKLIRPWLSPTASNFDLRPILTRYGRRACCCICTWRATCAPESSTGGDCS